MDIHRLKTHRRALCGQTLVGERPITFETGGCRVKAAAYDCGDVTWTRSLPVHGGLVPGQLLLLLLLQSESPILVYPFIRFGLISFNFHLFYLFSSPLHEAGFTVGDLH